MSVIGPPEILRRAEDEAKRLAETTNWKPAFVESGPETPLLVLRRDKTDGDYYLVSFRSGTRVTARLRMNAHTGRYAEGIGIDKLGDMLKPYYTPDQAHRRMARVLEAEALKGKKKKTPVIQVDPFLIWKPCAQSLSAFLPFYRFVAPGHEIYFRVDGKFYEALTFGAGL